MRDPITSSESAFDLAARRLDSALARLEQGLVAPGAGAREGRADLARQLEAARARERALEEVAVEASAALGRAADEVRAALAAEA